MQSDRPRNKTNNFKPPQMFKTVKMTEKKFDFFNSKKKMKQ